MCKLQPDLQTTPPTQPLANRFGLHSGVFLMHAFAYSSVSAWNRRRRIFALLLSLDILCSVPSRRQGVSCQKALELPHAAADQFLDLPRTNSLI